MGLLKEKIKQDLIQSIFTDSLKIFESIDSKFELTLEQKEKILEKVSNFNKELNAIVKDIKLS